MSFEERAGMAKSTKAKQLFHLMAEKKTNLCLACDVTDPQEILDLAEKCGPYICVFKTHMDIVDSIPPNFTSDLNAIAKRHNFFLMEDRKFSDIGNTVALQISRGPFKIAQWADFVTAHSLPGQGVIKGIKSGLAEENPKDLNVFLLAEMSCQGNLIDEKYKENTIKMAIDSTDVDAITGIVCQSKECFAFPGLIQLTPGVKINENTDDLGQQYNSPDYVVKSKGADIAVVGRGILNAKSPEKAAVEYRDALWAAYKERTESA